MILDILILDCIQVQPLKLFRRIGGVRFIYIYSVTKAAPFTKND